jgi:NADH/NAD ratio-sensing transcriptional regulator Rex
MVASASTKFLAVLGMTTAVASQLTVDEAISNTLSERRGAEMAGADGVRVGLIGVGRFARMAHVPALRTCEAARVTAVCDINPDALGRTADELGVDAAARYRSAGELIESGRVEAVIVSTPNDLHHPQARAALGVACTCSSISRWSFAPTSAGAARPLRHAAWC